MIKIPIPILLRAVVALDQMGEILDSSHSILFILPNHRERHTPYSFNYLNHRYLQNAWLLVVYLWI